MLALRCFFKCNDFLGLSWIFVNLLRIPFVFICVLKLIFKIPWVFQISYKPLRGQFHISRFFGNLFVALLDWIGLVVQVFLLRL